MIASRGCPHLKLVCGNDAAIRAWLAGINVVILVMFVVGTSGSFALEPRPISQSGSAQSRLDHMVDRFVLDNPDLPAVSIVAMRNGNVVYSAARGTTLDDGLIAFDMNTSVRIASITKTFVAAATLSTIDRFPFGLETPISDLLGEDFLKPLRDADYEPTHITLHHLLNHSSGLRDHSDSLRFQLISFLWRSHAWSSLGQVQLMGSLGAPLGQPGSQFSYSDTGYVLIGEILERANRKELHQVVREAINYRSLGMQNTWWEFMEPRPTNSPEPAHQYINGWDVTSTNSSVDLFGGGGLMASTKDMAVFLDALFHDAISLAGRKSKNVVSETSNSANLRLVDRMINDQAKSDASNYYYGIRQDQEDGLLAYGHSGYWGTAYSYYPVLDLTIALTVTEQSSLDEAMRLKHNFALMLYKEKSNAPTTSH